jgi:hypothetical protein
VVWLYLCKSSTVCDHWARAEDCTFRYILRTEISVVCCFFGLDLKKVLFCCRLLSHLAIFAEHVAEILRRVPAVEVADKQGLRKSGSDQ